MSMEREIISIGEHGNIIMPTDIAHVWMSEPELVELFGVIAPTLRAAVRAVYKSGVLKEYEVQKYVRLENGYYAMCLALRWWRHSLSVSIPLVQSRCAMPYLKGCACEKRKQVSSFRRILTTWIRLIIRRKTY